MIGRQKASISTQLLMMNMLASAAALAIACVAFFAYDQITFRQALLRTLSAQAQIIGSNSISALLFNDPQAAATTLSALKSSTNIASAGILTGERKPFAQYSRGGGDEMLNIPRLADDQIEGSWFRSTHAVLMRKIVSDGRLIGYVYVRADLREIDQRWRRYALISLAVLFASLLFAVVVSSRFRKSVADPIVILAETAQKVSRDQDFSVRVNPGGNRDELSTLMNSFNEMLREIQLRDNALQKAHDELEQRVSERTRELVSANQELDAFSYSVSHDLRGPLDALNGFSYLVVKNYSDKLDAKGKESLQNIRAAARRMSELIEDLLNLSRVATSSMHRQQIDLSALARPIIDELRRREPDREVEFVLPSVTPAFADPRLMQIVLDNLLRNAWKYTSHHVRARIEFGQETRDGQVSFFVKDDGSGFDSRSADRLFQPFQRLHSAAEFPGNGIGLATVRRIIQRHGGRVWAEGTVEQGATFYFALDAARTGTQSA
jgi:signal transduction histidine kinase